MQHHSQGKLRGLCLVLLACGPLSCGDEPSAPAGQAGQAPARAGGTFAEVICDHWRRRDGSCDPTVLLADFEYCERTQGVPERDRLERAGVRPRMQGRAMQRITNLCLEQRSWVITEVGRASQDGRPPKPSPPS